MLTERRKNIRIKKSLVVRYSKDDKWDISHIRDVSVGGVQITTKDSFMAGEALRLFTKIPSEPFKWLEFSGRVVDCVSFHNREGGFIPSIYLTRIEFRDLEYEQKSLVHSYIEWFLKRY